MDFYKRRKLKESYMKSKRIFVVIMRRYGDPENHTYFFGSWTSYEVAEIWTKAHMTDRAGKYDAVIYESYVDEMHDEVYRQIRWGDFDPEQAEKDFAKLTDNKGSTLQEG